jgi:hypothetical protein
MNTRSNSHNNRQPIAQSDPVIQSNLQPPPFPPLGSRDQERITALEAHIEALTGQNAELLLRNIGQPHPKMNQDEHEEEERLNHINSQGYREKDRLEDDHQEDNFREDDHQELRNRKPHRLGG